MPYHSLPTGALFKILISNAYSYTSCSFTQLILPQGVLCIFQKISIQVQLKKPYSFHIIYSVFTLTALL